MDTKTQEILALLETTHQSKVAEYMKLRPTGQAEPYLGFLHYAALLTAVTPFEHTEYTDGGLDYDALNHFMLTYWK